MTGRTIVAIGGGGVSQDTANPLLLDYLVGLIERPQPRVCLFGTASGDRESGLVLGYSAFSRRGCRVSHVSLFPREIEDLRGHLLAQDLIYVGGGNTANMLAIWRVQGIDALLREAWDSGILLAGVSAGAICWFDAGITDSFGPTLQVLRDGLGFLPGSCCPHYDGEIQRRPTYRASVAAGLTSGIALDDGCAARFDGTTLAEIVTSREEARAYRVERTATGDTVTETPLDARFLG